MPEITREELDKKIKTSPLGAYLLCGDEDFLVKAYTERLTQASVDSSFADFNLQIVECESPDLSDIYDVAMSVPMMAQSKCVVVKNYPAADADDSNFNQLRELLRDNPPENCLIFSYPAYKAKGKELSPVIKLFNEFGYVVKFTKQSQNELVRTLERGAKSRGAVFERGAAAYMVSVVGDDLNQLQNELDKVSAYSDGTIRRSDVDAVCIKSLYTRTFEMVKELAGGSFDRAFHMLDKLFEQREDEYMILGALVSQYTDIYRAKTAFASGKPIGELAKAYPSMYKGKEFKLNNVRKICSDMSFEQLCSCMEILADADKGLKFTQEDKQTVLEKTLVRLARAKGGAK